MSIIGDTGVEVPMQISLAPNQTGLVGTIGYTIYNFDKSQEIVSRTTLGIVELGGGSYAAKYSSETYFIGHIKWDWGTADEVWECISINIPHTTAVNLAGRGATKGTITVTIDTTPVPDCQVWATNDLAGDNTVASGATNSAGQIDFYLDVGVTYYIWRQKDGYNFTNPQEVTW